MEYKLVVLGGGAVGKTCLTTQFLHKHFTAVYDPTVEDAYRKAIDLDGQASMLDILDTAGQSEYGGLREQYMRFGQGFLLVYSVTSRESFEEIVDFHQTIFRVQEKPTTIPIPIVLVGNKSDLDTQREVSTVEGTDLAKLWGIPFFETSALNRTNVDECFHELVRSVRKHKFDDGTYKKQQKRKKDCFIL